MGSASSRALREGVAATWMRWYHAAAVPLRHLKQPERDANSPAWWAVPPGPARKADDAHDDAPDDRCPRLAFGKASGLEWRNCMTGIGAVAAAALGVLCVAAAVSLPMVYEPR
jgi:hypothetical protein